MTGASFQLLTELAGRSNGEMQPECFDELLECLATLRDQTAERRRALKRSRAGA